MFYGFKGSVGTGPTVQALGCGAGSPGHMSKPDPRLQAREGEAAEERDRLSGSQCSLKRRLRVQCQDLPQNERWKVTEGDIQCWLQAHTGECICTCVHMIHLHVPESSTARGFLSSLVNGM